MGRGAEAFARDDTFIARFVDIWRHPRNVTAEGKVTEGTPFEIQGAAREPVKINDIALELGVGQAQAAIKMKQAAKDGWVRRVGPRTEQYAYEPTEKALEQYPDGKPQVMPSAPQKQIASGLTVTPASETEARSWGEDGRYVEVGESLVLEPPENEDGPVKRGRAFKGYLPKGDE